MKRVLLTVLALQLVGVAASDGARTPRFPNGVFRTTITDADLRGHIQAQDIPEDHGT